MLRTAILLAAFFTLTEASLGATLPETGPLPQTREDKAVAVPEDKPTEESTTGDKAVDTKPETQTDDTAKAAGDTVKDKAESPKPGDKATPENTPIPEEKPATEDKPVPEEKPVSEEKVTPEKPEPKPVVEREDPAAYAACLVDLKASGAVFTEDTTIDDGDGCGIDKPLTVTSVGKGITLEPKGQMRCETALRLGEWAEKSINPVAQTAFGEKAKLVKIGQASTYVCRLRNNAETGEISEHARGNAVDIATLTFEGATAVEMQPRLEDSTMTGAFQRAITAAACLYFSTVLSPGSDAAHETHLHLDVLKRKNDYRFCR